ncbi:substrate-binding periplasmic protein [Neptuniibacter sp. PT34_22]|uniref:substrate-binding periplasmic protein n=1 Tax=Neptuniibacter sp. PT34_22 TaxID=3398205 RepID=UPI0039F485F5
MMTAEMGRIYRGCVLMVFCMCSGGALHAHGLTGKTISICDDGSEWPPFSYFERLNGNKSEKIIGYSVDVIKEIFDKHSIKFTIKLPPWKRCLVEVDKGNQFQMLLSAGLSSERAKKYLLSRPYYTTTRYYFWSKKVHPNGLEVDTSSEKQAFLDLTEKYKMGLIHGYGTGALEKAGVDLSKTDSGSKTQDALVRKLHAGRIDNFYSGFEVLSGLTLIGATNAMNDPDLGYAPLGSNKRKYQMMFTKNNPIGMKLKLLIDKELALMEASGRLDELLAPYMNSLKR